MKVTMVGHAGLHIESAAGTILCDPWLNPAYFASWFVFPDNSQLDWDALGNCDYLYISHLHHDHYDPANLRDHVSKEATVLLPEFPVEDLRAALEDLGFHRFVQTRNNQPIEVGGMRVMISALTSPSDGPLGDSLLAIDDGTATILNQNDARPVDFDALRSFVGDRRFDAHFLQFSGAIWWPLVYDLPERTKTQIATEKRANGMERALRYIEEIGADHVFPTAGPPCFLDEVLFEHNDLRNADSNIFPDQTVFIDFLRSRGHDSGRLLIPGSSAEIVTGAECTVTHAIGQDGVDAIFADKEGYLRAYQARQAERLAAEKASWPDPSVDILAELQAWFDPLLELAEKFREGIGHPVELMVLGGEGVADESIVIDFPAAKVRSAEPGERCRYRFRVERPIVERLIADHEIDWVNTLFLSMRFEAHRAGPYNEYLYSWFKCLNEERLEYAEGWYAERADSGEEIELDGWCMQRRCPHLKADLSHFGSVDDGVLTCRMHGWQWDLETGQCLTSDGHELRVRRAEG